MPFCPKCKVEYRVGFTRCSDCDVELVERLPSPDENTEWVEAGALPDPEFGGVVKEMMADAGIPCAFHGEVGEGIMESIQGPGQEVHVLVPRANLEAAKEILDAYFESGFSSEDVEFLTCSNCGCAVNEDDDICPACGEPLESEKEE
jgi:hypothetical protein